MASGVVRGFPSGGGQLRTELPPVSGSVPGNGGSCFNHIRNNWQEDVQFSEARSEGTMGTRKGTLAWEL